VVLVGASGAGKSTFARAHFQPSEVVSSDTCRALVADDENALEANREAFRLLHNIASSRLRLQRATVIDATNLQPGSRRALITLAREHDAPSVAIVLDVAQPMLEQRSAQRQDRRLPRDVIDAHHAQLQRALVDIEGEGFSEVHVLHSPEEIDSFVIERDAALTLPPRDVLTGEAALRWKRTWEAAWPRRDVEAIVALYAPAAEYRALIFREVDRGPEGVRRYLEQTFGEESDILCRFGDPIIQGDRAAVEWWASWVEEGRPLTLAGTTVLRFDAAGRVVDHRDYWNQVEERVDPYGGW
jgi:predicted kinase